MATFHSHGKTIPSLSYLFPPNKENNRFNGELLAKISHKKLTQIGVSSNIMQKKLMAWIEKGFTEFNQYLVEVNNEKENICPNLHLRKT